MKQAEGEDAVTVEVGCDAKLPEHLQGDHAVLVLAEPGLRRFRDPGDLLGVLAEHRAGAVSLNMTVYDGNCLTQAG